MTTEAARLSKILMRAYSIGPFRAMRTIASGPPPYRLQGEGPITGKAYMTEQSTAAFKDAGDDAAEQPRPPAPDSSNYVLVVDDEEVVRGFLTRCLESWGHAAREAGSAAEALETMIASPAALVLCDIRMPGQDGLWLVKRLRQHWPNTPVVMTTGIDDFGTVQQSRDLGALAYITKPIKTEILQQVVEEALRNQSAPAAAPARPAAEPATGDQQPVYRSTEAEYTLESPVRCPACGERVASLKAVRLVRAHVNFTSTLPRRGRVAACPHCLAIVPVELTNF
jgi:CheY-like chemotaxis protein